MLTGKAQSIFSFSIRMICIVLAIGYLMYGVSLTNPLNPFTSSRCTMVWRDGVLLFYTVCALAFYHISSSLLLTRLLRTPRAPSRSCPKVSFGIVSVFLATPIWTLVPERLSTIPVLGVYLDIYGPLLLAVIFYTGFVLWWRRFGTVM